MLKRHPTVQIPDIGPMDHAWDLLGEWQAEFELPESESPVHGKVTFRSWGDAELQLDPVEAAIAGIPSSVPLERASEVHLTDAGGGALQWVLHAPSTNWSLQATLWPGSLHLFVHDPEDEEEHLIELNTAWALVAADRANVKINELAGGGTPKAREETSKSLRPGRVKSTSRTSAASEYLSEVAKRIDRLYERI